VVCVAIALLVRRSRSCSSPGHDHRRGGDGHDLPELPAGEPGDPPGQVPRVAEGFRTVPVGAGRSPSTSWRSCGAPRCW
jgi:hypothetical protein